jgi:ribose-phosphate pyrophosphokinase
MIDTGGSIVSGACALKQRGARRVFAAATHAVLSRDALMRINESPIEELILTDTIPIPDAKRSPSDRLTVLSVAPLLADAIRRIHSDSSVSELFDKYW